MTPKYKKMTKKEVEQEFVRIENLNQHLYKEITDMKHLNISLGKLLDTYIEFTGKKKDFIKYIEKSLKKGNDEKNNPSDKLQKKTKDIKKSK
tara:strand:+ start:248 stop:523 length:276 start_codon:yes stop_codon:yes gene_type:complete